MKKNYNQPNVEVVEVLAISLMQAASPAGIGAGTNGGTTGNIGGGSSPIPGE